jgi:hypothetical protein
VLMATGLSVLAMIQPNQAVRLPQERVPDIPAGAI